MKVAEIAPKPDEYAPDETPADSAEPEDGNAKADEAAEPAADGEPMGFDGVVSSDDHHEAGAIRPCTFTERHLGSVPSK